MCSYSSLEGASVNRSSSYQTLNLYIVPIPFQRKAPVSKTENIVEIGATLTQKSFRVLKNVSTFLNTFSVFLNNKNITFQAPNLSPWQFYENILSF